MTEEVKSVEEAAEVKEVNTEESAEVKEEVAQEVTETDEYQLPPPVKKKQSAQDRIDEITRARREAEREAEYWRKKVLGDAKEEVREPVRTDGRPTIEQFNTAEEYEDALLEWHTAKREQKNLAEQKKREETDALEKFKERAAKVKEVYEDFDYIVERPVFSPTMRNTLLKSESGPEVSYFLGRPENQSIADRIKKLPPEDQIYELGKLETKLSIAKTTRKTTGAPPPITPVGTTTGGTDVDWSKLSDDEWFARREAEKRKKLQSRG
ncbi:MAG: hypothetical protein LLG05_12550 [Porphyromonadaceae bacterium]|nr:hypothetical protein [Porphyromonadaceae bacterium]